MSAVISSLRAVYRALRGIDAVTTKLNAILQEQLRMSAQSDRLNESIATLTATINNVVIPGLQNAQAATDEAAFANAADAVDAANSRLIAATTAAAAVPAPAPAPAPVDTGTADPVTTVDTGTAPTA